MPLPLISLASSAGSDWCATTNRLELFTLVEIDARSSGGAAIGAGAGIGGGAAEGDCELPLRHGRGLVLVDGDGEAVADYEAAMGFLENRIAGIRKALRGE